MRHSIASLMTCALLLAMTGEAGAQEKFPLAAPAGKDSNARQVPLAGAVNQGAFSDPNWKYGNAFNAPAGGKIWNPAKPKHMPGGQLVGRTGRGVGATASYHR